MANPKLRVSRSVAKLSKWNGCLPPAAASADLVPYQATRMVANMRNRCWPMASKKPRFWVSRSLMALKMNCKKSVCIRTGLLSRIRGKQLWHAEGFERICDAAGDSGQISGERGAARDVGVDGVGSGLALLFGDDGLLLEERCKELVSILNSAKGQDARGI